MKPKQSVSADEASEIAVEAYVFGYPLVLMDATRQVVTAVPKAEARKAPVNQFLFRSVVALIGLGANLPEDAIYPRATEDTDGQPLTGANRYVVHFPTGQLPPVNAFWSLTMYNSKQFFVHNPIDRYAIGDRDKLKFNDDGSLTINIQHESPGKEKESNWLPAPKDSFNVFMRLYWPKKEIVDGVWKAPGVERVN
jgi:hypothetical protein